MRLPIKISSVLLLVSILFLAGIPFLTFSQSENTAAQADELWDKQEGMENVGETFGESGEPQDVRDIAVDIIMVALSFLAIIFLILVISAGYKWMTAAGNEDKIKSAKSQLSHAIIGLIIVLSALAITKFISEALLDATGEGGLFIFSERAPSEETKNISGPFL